MRKKYSYRGWKRLQTTIPLLLPPPAFLFNKIQKWNQLKIWLPQFNFSSGRWETGTFSGSPPNCPTLKEEDSDLDFQCFSDWEIICLMGFLIPDNVLGIIFAFKKNIFLERQLLLQKPSKWIPIPGHHWAVMPGKWTVEVCQTISKWWNHPECSF